MSLIGSTSLANYRDALRAVTFRNTNPTNPSTLTRTVTFQAFDGDDNSNTQTRNITVIGAPLIGVSPDPINYGNVPVGVASVITVTISNTGGSTLTITNIVSNDGQFVPSTTSLSVAAGATGTFDVTFTPTSGAAQNATLTITSNTGNVPGTTTNVSMTGFGTIKVTPSNLDFGIVEVLEPKELTANIENETGAVVNITAIVSTNPQYVNITPLPLSIGHLANADITVRFTPDDKGTINGTLTITYNPDVTVSLTGCGGICGGTGSGSGSGGSDDDDDDEREPFTVPFGGEVYLLMLVAGYGIYTLSRRKR